MTTTTTHQLCITPRAAVLEILADPTLEDAYRVSWQGAAPRVRERGEAIDLDYTIAERLRSLFRRGGSLTLALNPAVTWAIELRGGVAGLRANLRDLRVSAIVISGGARDLALDLPKPSGELALRVEGGISQAIIRRPAAVPVSVQIDGGATGMRLDNTQFGSIGGVVRQHTPGDPNSDGQLALRILGGASDLTVQPAPSAEAADR